MYLSNSLILSDVVGAKTNTNVRLSQSRHRDIYPRPFCPTRFIRLRVLVFIRIMSPCCTSLAHVACCYILASHCLVTFVEVVYFRHSQAHSFQTLRKTYTATLITAVIANVESVYGAMVTAMASIPLEESESPYELGLDRERGQTSRSTYFIQELAKCTQGWSDPESVNFAIPNDHQASSRAPRRQTGCENDGNCSSEGFILHSWTAELNIFYDYCFIHGFGALICIPVLLPLVLVAQKNVFGDFKCVTRQQGCGFEGNEDAYGLGIRLGAYLQWIACSLVANVLPAEERPLLGAMCVFSASLMAAILVLTFEGNCTYAVEIIIMLFIVVENELLIRFTTTGHKIFAEFDRLDSDAELAPSQSRVTQVNSLSASSGRSTGVRGWLVGISLVDIVVMAYSAWFWIRMAAGDDRIFAGTPCGTSIFFIARVKSSGIPIISGFIAAACITVLAANFMDWALHQMFPKKIAKIMYILFSSPTVLPAFVLYCIVLLPFAFLAAVYHPKPVAKDVSIIDAAARK